MELQLNDRVNVGDDAQLMFIHFSMHVLLNYLHINNTTFHILHAEIDTSFESGRHPRGSVGSLNYREKGIWHVRIEDGII